MAFSNFSIGVVNEFLVCIAVGPGIFSGDVSGKRIVRCDYGHTCPEYGLLEQLEIFASFIDTSGHQDGRTA